MTTIAQTVTNQELYAFANSDHPDVACGLTGMLRWSYPSETDYTTFVRSDPNAGYPFWPVASMTSTAAAAFNTTYATQSINQMLPITSAVSSAQLTTNILATVSMFSFLMLYNQLAKFRGVQSIDNSDKIQQICIDVVNLANLATPLTVPLANPTTTLKSTINAAQQIITAYVAANPPGAAGAINGMNELATLVPRMFSAYWTLRYYSSFATGGIAGATFYDQRYSQLAIANAFDLWVNSMGATPQVLTYLNTARKNTVSSTEDPAHLGVFYQNNRDKVNTAITSVNALQDTSAQFVRRQGSVGSMSENLAASRKRTDLALAALLVWIGTLVTSVAIASFLILRKDYPLVLALVIVNITLLLIDAIGRGVVGSRPSPYS